MELSSTEFRYANDILHRLAFLQTLHHGFQLVKSAGGLLFQLSAEDICQRQSEVYIEDVADDGLCLACLVKRG